MEIINSSFYNTISIILGLTSLVFAVYNIIVVSRKGIRHNSWLVSCSIILCIGSLYFQILWTGHLINTNNLSSLVESHSLTRLTSTIYVIVLLTLYGVGFILAKTNRKPEPIVTPQVVEVVDPVVPTPLENQDIDKVDLG